MQPHVKGVAVAILGGDTREIILARRLADIGARVKVMGLPVDDRRDINVCPDISTGLPGVQAVILPVRRQRPWGDLFGFFWPAPDSFG